MLEEALQGHNAKYIRKPAYALLSSDHCVSFLHDRERRNLRFKLSPGVDLVVHTAGPFQREAECTVLQAANT